MVDAEPLNVFDGGFVESVVTVLTHRRFVRFAVAAMMRFRAAPSVRDGQFRTRRSSVDHAANFTLIASVYDHR
jgi:hypothetical protein